VNKARCKPQQILRSFPEPILNHAEASKYLLQSLPEGLSGPAQDEEIDKRNLLAVASVHGHAQGENLQAFHSHIISCKKSHGEWFYRILTNEVSQFVLSWVLLIVNAEVAKRTLFNTNP
jgi:hypothetical protein